VKQHKTNIFVFIVLSIAIFPLFVLAQNENNNYLQYHRSDLIADKFNPDMFHLVVFATDQERMRRPDSRWNILISPPNVQTHDYYPSLTYPFLDSMAVVTKDVPIKTVFSKMPSQVAKTQPPTNAFFYFMLRKL